MRNLVTVAILCAGVYAAIKWQAITPQGNEVTDFAKTACVTDVGGRYNVSNIRAYDVRESNNGFSVRVSATNARGAAVKIVCLTNSHGGVREITIDER